MKRILCIGDSHTWGHNPSDKSRFDESVRWPMLLQATLGSEYTIIEEGLCGRCAAFIDSVKPHCYGIGSIRMLMESHQPLDMVVLMLGTNDVKAQFSPHPIAIANGVKEMIDIIQNPCIYRGYKPPKVLLVAPPHIRDNYHEIERIKEQFQTQSYDVCKQLSKHYQQVAKSCDCLFMDAAHYVQASTSDAVHMDAENHALFAHAIHAIIDAYD